MFRARFEVTVTYWGAKIVGELSELSEFFTRHQLVPQKGDAVHLPEKLRGARSTSTPDPDGYTTELVTARLYHTGTVSTVRYDSRASQVTVGVQPLDGHSEEVES